MRIVLAPDSFKESMSAIEAIEAMERGIREIIPDAITVHCPLADGGEGSSRTLTDALGGQVLSTPVHDAFGRPLTGEYGWVPGRGLALLEVAEACGLEHLSAEERDVMRASSFGVADLLNAALAHTPNQVILGLGGTATNDGGIGLLQELGAQIFFNADSAATVEPVEPGQLGNVCRVDLGPVIERLRGIDLVAASDVTNPLTGENGATAIFGPQKGANAQQVAELDKALAHWGRVLGEASQKASASQTEQTNSKRDLADHPGAGAAGGIGAALLAIGARVVPGIDLVMELVGLEQKLQGADLIMTGEGKVDSQTEQGKVLSGVLAQAQRAGVPAIAFGGAVESTNLAGWESIIQITPAGQPLPEALARGSENLQRAAAQALANFLRK